MDAYDISEKIKNYWVELVPKNSGEINKSKNQIKVIINTDQGYREVRFVQITDNHIELILDNE